jgi:ribosomal protein L11 methyltransferase
MYEFHIGAAANQGAAVSKPPTEKRAVWKAPLLEALGQSVALGYTRLILMYIWRKRVTTDWLGQRSEDLMRRFGSALAIIEQPGKARTLVEVSCGTRKKALELRHELGGTIEKLRDDWLEQLAKRNRAKPLRIGSRLIVSRTRVPKATAARTIVIPAEAAFGTGEHATTAMCLRMLERITRRRETGWSMLDAGTGSGILAIAGSCFGADRIVAIDNDPLACAVALRNAEANRIHNINFRTGDVLTQRFPGKIDIITANLYSEILIAALPAWKQLLAANGFLILSGILRSQESTVVSALRRSGFVACETRRRGKWIALLASRAGKKS